MSTLRTSRSPFFEHFAARRVSWIAGNHRHGRAMQVTWDKATVAHETSFTLRGATQVTLQHHQILRLPRKSTLMIDPGHTWNVIYIARNNRGYLPTSPNTVAATTKDSHDWSWSHMTRHSFLCGTTEVALQHHQILRLPPRHDWSWSHMKRHLHCAKQQRLPSNITKYCGCHDKGLSWLILVTHDTSFIFVGNNRGNPPTSPNFAPATASWLILVTHETSFILPGSIDRENFRKWLKCHLHCGADSSMIRPWSSMIRAWTCQSATRRATEVTFRTHHAHFVLKITTFRAPAIIPNFPKYCACHEQWQLNCTKYCTGQENLQ